MLCGGVRRRMGEVYVVIVWMVVGVVCVVWWGIDVVGLGWFVVCCFVWGYGGVVMGVLIDINVILELICLEFDVYVVVYFFGFVEGWLLVIMFYELVYGICWYLFEVWWNLLLVWVVEFFVFYGDWVLSVD